MFAFAQVWDAVDIKSYLILSLVDERLIEELT